MENGEFNLQPFLTGNLISLRPLLEADFDRLYECASDPEIWSQHPQPNRYKRGVFRKFFDEAMVSKGALAVIDLEQNKIIGSSRYYNLNHQEKHLTIGYTFLERTYWGGKYNRELKKLMMEHAFKVFDSIRFEIGANNMRSRNSIEKIGASLLKNEILHDQNYVIYKMDKGHFLQLFSRS
jgi:N-acetyltransferase